MDKNIIMISGSDFSQTDGPVLHFYSLYQKMRELNPYVFAVAPIRKKTVSYKNMHFIFSSSIPVVASVIFQIRLMFFLLFFVFKHQKVVFYVRSHYAMITPVCFSIIFKIPLVSEFNGIIDDYAKHRSNVVMKVGKVIEKIISKSSSAIIVVTPNIKTWINNNYNTDNEKINVILNASDPSRFLIKNYSLFRKDFLIEPANIIITYVGTLSWWQGVDVLIKAFEEIYKTKTNLDLFIVGDGPEKNKLKLLGKNSLAKDNIKFIGKVEADMAAKYMCASDICVAPKMPISSGYSPLKLYEYMAAAKPIVASRLPGFEIIEDIDCGLLFEPKNHFDLSEKILKLIDMSSEERFNFGSNGRIKVEKEMNWSIAAQKTLEVISKL